MAVIWNTPCKKCILWARDIKSMFFLIVIISASKTSNLFVFLVFVSVINFYFIYGLHLFWDSFEWFCLQISTDAIFSLSYPRYCDRRLIVVIVYYFQIWNKKKNTTLLLVELFAVTWVWRILRDSIEGQSWYNLNNSCWG